MTAARLSIRQQNFLNRRHAIPFRETGRKLEIVAAASRNAAGRNQLSDFRADHRDRASANFRANAAGATHSAEMPEQSKSGHINGCFEKPSLSECRSNTVELGHNGDHFSLQQTAGQAALDSCSDDTCAQRFRQDQDVARTRVRIGEHAPRRYEARYRESVNWFLFTNPMPTE